MADGTCAYPSWQREHIPSLTPILASHAPCMGSARAWMTLSAGIPSLLRSQRCFMLWRHGCCWGSP